VHVRTSDAPAHWHLLSLIGHCGFPLVAETMVGTGTVVVAIATTVEEATEMYLRPRLPGDCSPLLIADTFSSAGVLRAVQAGASTMLCSSGVTSVQVSTAVQAAYWGDSRVPQQALIQALAGQAAAPARRPAPAGGRRALLTDRQRAVVALMAEGLGNAEIAQELCWSEHTVKNVGYELMASLQVRNRAQAVALALREGLI
jgi:DNA-binding NarL/FixJ family response regulator